MSRADRGEEEEESAQYIYSQLVLLGVRLAVLVPFEVDQDASPARLAELVCFLLVAEVVLCHVIISFGSRA